MNALIRRLIPSLVSALCLLSTWPALGGGGDNDPVINAYKGTAILVLSSKVNGILNPVASGTIVQDAFDIEFKTGHQAVAASFDGKWKKKNSRYSVDCSAHATQVQQGSVNDPKAKVIFKCIKITLEPGDGVTGTVKEKLKFRIDLLNVRTTVKGAFGAPILP